MVLLPNSGDLAGRYAPYIEELQEFFALHDLRYGTPPELGFFAARLSGRDSFPSELASMVRSFIFREGGSIPLHDLRTVVALAVGGPAVEGYAEKLQHPLHDLSAFLSSVARAPLDEPSPAIATSQAEEGLYSSEPAAKVRSYASPYQADASGDPFVQVLQSASLLTPAILSDAVLQRQEPQSASLKGKPNRKLWGAVAIGLPVLLLALFLLYDRAGPSSPGSTPEANTPGIASATPSISAPHANPQTPLSSAAAALAGPASSSLPHAAATPPSTIARSGVTQPVYALPAGATPALAAAANPATLAQPWPTPGGASSSPKGSTVTAASVAPSAASSSASVSAPAPRAASPHTASGPASIASVSAQQGAFGISSGIMSSHLLSFSPPKYPKMAGLTHAQGQVILQAVVAKSGRVSAVKAITGPRTLRKAAENAVRQWRYRPYVQDGRPADVATIITIDVKAPH